MKLDVTPWWKIEVSDVSSEKLLLSSNVAVALCNPVIVKVPSRSTEAEKIGVFRSPVILIVTVALSVMLLHAVCVLPAASLHTTVKSWPTPMRLPRTWPSAPPRGADGHVRGNLMGVGHDFTVVCKDAAGNTQTACNSMTDSATVTIKMTGDLKTPIFSASVDREGTFTITGLQSATATFDDNSSFSLDTSLTSIFHQGVTSSFMFDATADYKAITIATADHTI